MSRRSRPLARQLIAPVVGLLLAGVLASVAASSWVAARRSAAAARAAQERLAEALAAARFPLTQPILDTLARLTGSDFVIWSPADGAVGLSTLDAQARDRTDFAAVAAAAAIGKTIAVAGTPRRVGLVRLAGARPETVLVITPVPSLARTVADALWPEALIAAGMLALLVPLGLKIVNRLAGRIAAVERHVGRIAAGEFGHTLGGAAVPDDEIGRLATGVDRMSLTLAGLRDTLVAGERQRLLGQLAAGFAHELRNAVTGATLAIGLHRRRCRGAAGRDGPDDSLDVATRQLEVLEEEVRGLLALGRPEETQPVRVDVGELLHEVRDLTAPRCDHAGVRLECAPVATALVGRREALRAALVNLALNGIDAAGRDGTVRLSARERAGRVSLVVEDTGPGPPAHLRDTLHEPFVTGKPEGIGLGLAVAAAVAEAHGGTLAWDRAAGLTRFTLALPAGTPAPAEPAT
ncbi:MAG: ATP-binding protein [Planctomycetaceae bacterium]